MCTSRRNVINPVIVSTLSVMTAVGFAALAFSSSKPRIVDLTEISIDKTTGLRMYEGQPYSGEARLYLVDGTLTRAEQFKEGRRHGFLRMWFPDGSPSFDSSYEAGKRDGTTISWWDNGNLRSRTHYVGDQPDGVAWSWYRTGEKFKRYHYEAGQPVGIQQGWRRNGKLFSNFEYRGGRAYGLRNSNLCVELEDELVAYSN